MEHSSNESALSAVFYKCFIDFRYYLAFNVGKHFTKKNENFSLSTVILAAMLANAKKLFIIVINCMAYNNTLLLQSVFVSQCLLECQRNWL